MSGTVPCQCCSPCKCDPCQCPHAPKVEETETPFLVNCCGSKPLPRAASKPKPMFRVKRLTEKAQIPKRGSDGAAGYDLFAAYDGIVPKRGKALIKTDLSMAIAADVYGRVAPRSGLAWKNSIDVGAGVIDSDYRGNIGVILFNHADEDFQVKEGDRIAQLIFEKIQVVDFDEVEDLDDTTRGEGGFGSTGQ